MQKAITIVAALVALATPAAAEVNQAVAQCTLMLQRDAAKFQRTIPVQSALTGAEFERSAKQSGGPDQLRRRRELGNLRQEIDVMIMNYVANPGYHRCRPDTDSSAYIELRPDVAAEVKRLEAIRAALK